ncbi:hypothetical protein OO7_01096 [Providencia sneebia DSM 19967]|uniref:Uncharacterized protein n=1 Tax=Providencia sneebia DSM 19967 TaxID=1141660 RepID=K8WKX0_9GAMM|nr:hypothetical protein OO7_01096 [Providencia sneebia DSM 19967]
MKPNKKLIMMLFKVLQLYLKMKDNKLNYYSNNLRYGISSISFSIPFIIYLNDHKVIVLIFIYFIPNNTAYYSDNKSIFIRNGRKLYEIDSCALFLLLFFAKFIVLKLKKKNTKLHRIIIV